MGVISAAAKHILREKVTAFYVAWDALHHNGRIDEWSLLRDATPDQERYFYDDFLPDWGDAGMQLLDETFKCGVKSSNNRKNVFPVGIHAGGVPLALTRSSGDYAGDGDVEGKYIIESIWEEMERVDLLEDGDAWKEIFEDLDGAARLVVDFNNAVREYVKGLPESWAYALEFLKEIEAENVAG